MNIKLLPPDPTLAETLYRWRQDPVAAAFNPFENLSVETLRNMLSTASGDFKDYEKVNSLFWFLGNEEQIIGHFNLKSINKMMFTAEIGYGIGPNHRSRGLATAAMRMATKQIFEHTPLRKLCAGVHQENLASQRVLEKSGYIREGILREHYLVSGKPANEVIYGLLRGEIIESEST